MIYLNMDEENQLELIGFIDCPNIDKAKRLLNKLRLKYKLRIITQEEAKSIPEYFGSPSILLNGKNIEKGEPNWGCRIVNWDDLEKKLKELKKVSI